MQAAFDQYAGSYDAALNEGLSLSGESKEYFAQARVRWLANRLRERGVARSGFEILSTDSLFIFPRALAALRPLEASLTRVPAGALYMVLCRKARW